MQIDSKVIVRIIAKGVIDCLRESGSVKGHRAWFAINTVLNDEWDGMCEVVAKEVIETIDEEFSREDEDGSVRQMRKLRRSIDNLTEIIKITFGRKNESISEILKRGL